MVTWWFCFGLHAGGPAQFDRCLPEEPAAWTTGARGVGGVGGVGFQSCDFFGAKEASTWEDEVFWANWSQTLAIKPSLGACQCRVVPLRTKPFDEWGGASKTGHLVDVLRDL